MIRVVIVENEPAPAEILMSQLQTLFIDIEVLEICETVQAGLTAIKNHLPDLVFMDVELNNGEKGFEILEKLERVEFEIIFITSFDKYAKQACKASALYFLEKPVDNEELVSAIEKYRNRKRQLIDPKQIELLLSVYNNQTLSLKKLAIPTMKGLDFVQTDSIIYCEGAGNQTMIYFSGSRKECVHGTLKVYEDLLSPSSFHRIHKSYLINLNHIERYIKGKDGIVEMSGNPLITSLPVSRDYKDAFLRRFGRH
jgi:two-component system LytT family response regulator